MSPTDRTRAPVDDLALDGEPGPVVRRAPFSDNPTVGARGQRTQQRIVDAALQTFGEKGYHQCSIDRITRLAGCSRVGFYQYFSGKEDLFRHLSGQVARQLDAVDRGARTAHARRRRLGRATSLGDPVHRRLRAL